MEGYVATIGFFDGVHRGHRCLIGQVKDLAARFGMRSMVVTFDRHPRQVLCSDYQPRLLSSLSEKMAMLCECGVDKVELLQFTKSLSSLTAFEFMRDVLKGQLGVKVLLMGYDHKFGHGGGTFPEYVEWGREVGIEVLLASELEDVKVSSSKARRLVEEGRIDEANVLLGHPFMIEGQVTEGHHVGREIGYPTANLRTDSDMLLPPVGVYAVQVLFGDGSVYGGMLCIGDRPTLENGDDISVEVNIFDFEGDLYGSRLRLRVLSKIRDEEKFPGVEQLKEQLRSDEQSVRRLLSFGHDK